MSFRRSCSGEEICCGLEEESLSPLGKNIVCKESKGRTHFEQRKFIWSVSQTEDQASMYKENDNKKMSRIVHMALCG